MIYKYKIYLILKIILKIMYIWYFDIDFIVSFLFWGWYVLSRVSDLLMFIIVYFVEFVWSLNGV